MRCDRKAQVRQHGYALLILLTLLGLGAVAFLVGSMNTVEIQNSRDRITRDALAQAKEALIAYAATHTRPGSLPCPDTNNDGIADANSPTACYSRIGRLPWKSLGLGDLQDSYGERLWYALSANFANTPASLLINSDDTRGQLNLCPLSGCGNVSPIPQPPTTPPYPTSGVVAIVMSAGSVVSGNNRVDGADTNPNPAFNTDAAKKATNYLDAAQGFNNATGTSNGNDFIAALRADAFNDQLVPILDTEIFLVVNKRMENIVTLSQIANCISEYGKGNADFSSGDKRLPWPTELSVGNPTNKNSYDDSPGRLTGHLPYLISNSTLTLPVHNWSMADIPPSKRNTMAACSSWPSWWDSWKAHVFYAIGNNFAPGSTSSMDCASNPSGCLKVNGGTANFAAILIFAGHPLAGQERDTIAKKQDPTNYLEGGNLAAIQANTGNGNFIKGLVSTTLDDLIVCIRSDMSVDPSCS